MKVGILTHQQHINYGGILQCFALSTYLKLLGHEPLVIRRVPNKSNIIKRILRSFLKQLGLKHFNQVLPDRAANVRSFVEENLNRTAVIDSHSLMNKVCNQYQLEAVLVGSDQVWRRDFAINFGFDYFLDFVPSNVIKASYAASFGLNTWDYTNDESKIIKRLLQEFRGISVREKEAVGLCKSHLEMDAELLIDPTMLLNDSIYGKYSSDRIIQDKYVFVYWLGDLNDISKYVSEYESLGYKVKVITLRGNHVVDSVEDWLSYIKYADIVLTDSFHGCVFSMLFHKQFVAYCNKSGGYGRIQSLFESMGISDKLENPKMNVDYTIVDNQMEALRAKANNYLQKILQ